MSINAVGSAGLAQSLSISASGIRDATLRLDVAANNVANVNTRGFVPSKVSSSAVPTGGVQSTVAPFVPNPAAPPPEEGDSQTDLATEFVNVIAARAAFKANAKMMSVTAETSETLINMIS
jgi:flagellar basal-body rod protein FlgC